MSLEAGGRVWGQDVSALGAAVHNCRREMNRLKLHDTVDPVLWLHSLSAQLLVHIAPMWHRGMR